MEITNAQIREAIRRIYCMSYTDFIALMEFPDNDYGVSKFRQVQDNPAMALVNDLDEWHSNRLLDWALNK